MGRPSSSGAGELGCCANTFRVLFVIFNVIYLVLGIIGFAISVWQIVASATYDFVTGSSTVNGAVISLVVDIFIITVAVVGILGAVFRWRPLLLIYSIIWALVILLGIAAAGISFYYSDNVSAEAEAQYRDAWRDAIQDYNTSSDVTDSVDAFQKGLECCGIDNSSDWVTLNPSYFRNNTYRLPESCQCTSGDNCLRFSIYFDGQERSQTAFNRGCYDRTVDLIQAYSFVVGIIAIIFAIIETFGVIVAIGLIICITRARKKEIV